MAQNYGIPASGEHHGRAPTRPAARYLVLIDAAADGARLARLFTSEHAELTELDGSAPEVLAMVHGQTALGNAVGAEWNVALASHTAEERAAAQVFELSI